MNRRLLALFALICFSSPAYAAEPLPGDACAAANNLQFTSGPEVSGGGGHAMLCQGGTWKSILSFNSAAGLTKLGNQTCATNEILKFNGTTWACAADASGTSGITALTGDVTASGSGSVVSTISANAIGSAEITDSTIASADIAADTIAAVDIATGGVATAEILDATILVTDLSATGTASATTYLRGDNTWATVPSGADNLGNHTASTNIILGANWLSGDGGAEGVRIDPSGSVGIGTSSPEAKLHVAGGGSGNILLDNQGSITAKDAGGVVRNVLHGRWSDNVTYLDGGTGGLNLRVNNSTSQGLFINSSGNVGVGTTSQTQKLDVAGTVKATAFVGDGSGLTGLPGGSSPQGTWCGLATAGYLAISGGCQTYTSIFPCNGTSVLSSCPAGYTNRSLNTGTSNGSACMLFCSKN